MAIASKTKQMFILKEQYRCLGYLTINHKGTIAVTEYVIAAIPELVAIEAAATLEAATRLAATAIVTWPSLLAVVALMDVSL
jgi:hypothetical protein